MSGAPYRELSVVVTGASSGIGREIARQVAAQGGKLALAARDLTRLEALADECRRLGGKAVAVVTDVREAEACRALVARAAEAHGGIDVLVANAGVSMWATFEEIQDLAPFEDIMRVNYLGAVYCTHAALPHLRRSKGRILAVSSVTGRLPVPTRTGYAASKHAMAGFFDTLRIELGDGGVSVTVAFPDFVATEVRERAYGADGKPLGKSPVAEGKVMTADACARLLLDAAARRRREVYTSPRARLGMWLRLVAPGVVDRMAAKAVASAREA